MSWCMCLATAVTWTTCYFLRAVPPGAGAAAYRRRDQPNFWPAGPIFRRLGAFFIRRTLKAINFIPPFSVSISANCSAWLFRRVLRGRRSFPHGAFADPKTGTLSMTIQAMLRGGTRRLR